jgi:signal transduction histidine kinase
LYAIGALIKAVITTKSFYRRQVVQLLTGTSLIVLPNIIYVLGLSPFGSDITPIFFGPAGAIILWSIFHSGMFELVPIARTAVIEAMEAGVIVIDVKDRVLDMNPAFKRIAKTSLTRYYLSPIDKICKNIPEVAKIMKDRTISHTDFMIYDNEHSKVYEIVISQLNDKKGNNIGMLGLIYDISEKKLAQKEYAEHQWRMAVIDERERMSRDLHDNLGQVLGFINFQSQAIKQELVKEGIELVSDKLEQLIIAVQNAHSDMREYISSNRLSVNVERDFISSLTNDIERFKQQTGLPVRFDLPEEPIVDKFNSALMANLQYIIREAMNNIRKHAQAAEVRIAIRMKEDFMVVSVADNGKGFETIENDYTIKNRFGLDIMRERAALIGGSISIESIPNKGSRVMIYVPRTGGNQSNENEGNAC